MSKSKIIPRHNQILEEFNSKLEAALKLFNEHVGSNYYKNIHLHTPTEKYLENLKTTFRELEKLKKEYIDKMQDV